MSPRRVRELDQKPQLQHVVRLLALLVALLLLAALAERVPVLQRLRPYRLTAIARARARGFGELTPAALEVRRATAFLRLALRGAVREVTRIAWSVGQQAQLPTCRTLLRAPPCHASMLPRGEAAAATAKAARLGTAGVRLREEGPNDTGGAHLHARAPPSPRTHAAARLAPPQRARAS